MSAKTVCSNASAKSAPHSAITGAIWSAWSPGRGYILNVEPLTEPPAPENRQQVQPEPAPAASTAAQVAAPRPLVTRGWAALAGVLGLVALAGLAAATPLFTRDLIFPPAKAASRAALLSLKSLRLVAIVMVMMLVMLMVLVVLVTTDTSTSGVRNSI